MGTHRLVLGGEGGGVGGRRGRGVEDVKRLDGAVEEVGGEAVYIGSRRSVARRSILEILDKAN